MARPKPEKTDSPSVTIDKVVRKLGFMYTQGCSLPTGETQLRETLQRTMQSQLPNTNYVYVLVPSKDGKTYSLNKYASKTDI